MKKLRRQPTRSAKNDSLDQNFNHQYVLTDDCAKATEVKAEINVRDLNISKMIIDERVDGFTTDGC